MTTTSALGVDFSQNANQQTGVGRLPVVAFSPSIENPGSLRKILLRV
jgi:hypothetical protein